MQDLNPRNLSQRDLDFYRHHIKVLLELCSPEQQDSFVKINCYQANLKYSPNMFIDLNKLVDSIPNQHLKSNLELIERTLKDILT